MIITQAYDTNNKRRKRNDLITELNNSEDDLMIKQLQKTIPIPLFRVLKSGLNINSLADEILIKILSYLELSDLQSILLVNHKLYHLAYDSTLWSSIPLQDYYRSIKMKQLNALISHCPDVSKLNLRGFCVLELNGLGGCQNLRELNLSHCYGIVEQHLVELFSQLTRVQRLDLSGLDGVTNKVLDLVLKNGYRVIKDLDVGYCRNVQIYFIKLNSLTKIRNLNLSGHKMVQLNRLPKFRSIGFNKKELNLSNTSIYNFSTYLDEKVIRGVTKLNLNSARLVNDNKGVTFLDLPLLINSKRIEYINLENTKPELSNLSQLSLMELTHLSYLNISYTGCTNHDLLSFIGNCKSLEALLVNGCRLITDFDFTSLKKLRQLECDDLVQLTDDFLYTLIYSKTEDDQIGSNGDGLKLLSILDCSNLSKSVILLLGSRFSSLKVRSVYTNKSMEQNSRFRCLIL